MNAFFIIVFSTILSSIILWITKFESKKFENILLKVVLISFFGLIFCLILMSNEYQLKGRYTTYIIGLSFGLSTMLLFGLTKKLVLKIFTGLIAIPAIILGIMTIFWRGTILFFFILYTIFQPPLAKFKINEFYNMEVKEGGFKSCGESIHFTKSIYGILDKQIYVSNNACVIGIYRIETLVFNTKEYDFLIFHDGTFDKANPYRFKGVFESEK